jgi:pyruvate,water dikinase
MTSAAEMLNPSPEFLRWFEDLTKEDVPIAGGKGANLGELTRAGLPVPPGFVILSPCFDEFLRSTNLKKRIGDRLAALNVDDTVELEETAKALKEMVAAEEIPEEISRPIAQSYAKLAELAGEKAPFVAVRSSATAEDSAEASFAGMNETFLNIHGPEDLLDAVRRCWASLYGSRVLFYRQKQGIPEEKLSIAAVVQVMIPSEKSGVMFTVDPATGDAGIIVIEGAFGLGDSVVSGSITPDHYAVDAKTLEVVEQSIRMKDFMDARGAEGGVVHQKLDAERANAPSLNQDEVRKLAVFGQRIQEHYGAPQDIEWAIVGDRIYIVQTRPVTAVGGGRAQAGKRVEIVRGLAASPGTTFGVARILAGIEESDRFRAGDILVTRMTAPDWVPLMRKASGIVTAEGGTTAHAAIVSRELGIPCVVGATGATEKIRDGETITLDAREGVVYKGKVEEILEESTRTEARAKSEVASEFSVPVTGTKLYVNLGEPEMARQVAAMPVDGVGLLRAEFMVLAITNNVHPRKLMQEGRGEELMQKLADGLRVFGEAFDPRPVIFRATDFRSNEYRDMTGGSEFEPQESNPMIGYRGAYRYISEPDIFDIELRAIKKARTEYRLRNLHLMIPFARTLSEMESVVGLVERAGLISDEPGRMELWVMAEVPSVIFRLEDYASLGVTGVSIGSNDLTQLMLGVDRDSTKVAPLFDERDKAVMEAMRLIVEGCRALGITCSICGQAPSVYPELTAKLVEWGITSISVNPDVITRTRRLIASAEQQLILEKAHRMAA